MEHLTEIRLPSPISLNVPIPLPGRRDVTYAAPRQQVAFDVIYMWIKINTVTRQIWVQFAKIPKPLMIYGPDDFAAACPDTPDQHAERVRQILGADPATVLQALLDGADLPPAPQRVPRSIRAWQARELLRRKSLLDRVVGMVKQCGDTAVIEAWEARENLARYGKTVLAMAAAIGLSAAEIDEFFIEAAKLEV